jgi:hypothetical protein
LLPSSVVFTRGGKRYVAVVREGSVKVIPVRVQFDDGNVVKFALVVNTANPNGGSNQEELEQLTGDEEIVISGQGELSDGRSVIAMQQSHW